MATTNENYVRLVLAPKYPAYDFSRIVADWFAWTLPGRKEAYAAAQRPVQVGDRDPEVLTSASELARMRGVIEAMERSGVPYSFNLYGLTEPSSGGSKTFIGQAWDFVTSPPVLLVAGGVGGMLATAPAAAGGAGAAGAESAGAAASGSAAASGAGSAVYLDALEQGLAAYTNIGGAVAPAAAPWWQSWVDTGKDLVGTWASSRIAQSLAPDVAAPAPAGVPVAPGASMFGGAPGNANGGVFSPAAQRQILLFGGLGLAAVVLIVVLKK